MVIRTPKIPAPRAEFQAGDPLQGPAEPDEVSGRIRPARLIQATSRKAKPSTLSSHGESLVYARRSRLERRVGPAGNQATSVGKALGPGSQPFDESLAPLLNQLAVRRVCRQVALFAGIGLQVEQVLSAVVRAPDVLEAAVGQPMERLVLAVAGGMFEVEPRVTHVVGCRSLPSGQGAACQ